MKQRNIFFHQENPSELLNRAHAIVTFVQGWSDTAYERALSESELAGMFYSLEVVNFLLEQAYQKLQKPNSE